MRTKISANRKDVSVFESDKTIDLESLDPSELRRLQKEAVERYCKGSEDEAEEAIKLSKAITNVLRKRGLKYAKQTSVASRGSILLATEVV